jgi:hypothetical protein
VDEALASQGLTVHVGITSGEAFCGLVGVPKRRCEYGVMGPSVNLAARLMCMCEKKGVRILCCDQMYAELHDVQRDRQFLFEPFEPVSVKGYSQPVAIYHPKPDQWLMDVKKMLEQVQIFGLLTPREQSLFLEAMVEKSFSCSTEIITEGEEVSGPACPRGHLSRFGDSLSCVRAFQLLTSWHGSCRRARRFTSSSKAR